MSWTLCKRYKHCKDIDITGEVTCRASHTGKIKSYCEDFVEKEP